jgi:DNA-binding GntR family transcriptional regulator
VPLVSRPGAVFLPPRALARFYGVSRNTVMTAYDELAAAGPIQESQGAGTLVRRGGPHPFDLRLVMHDAQHPARTLSIDADGNPSSLSVR